MTEPRETLENFEPCLELPNHALIVGATMSGKTTLALTLLTNPSLFLPRPARILFYYDQLQEKYLTAKKKLASLGVDLLLHKGFPNISLESVGGGGNEEQTLILVDDFSEAASASKELARIATNGRHRNISLWIILHSLYNKSPESRTIMQNTRWFFFLPSLRLTSQLRTFGAQLGLLERIIYAFERCQKEGNMKNRYIVVDAGPQTPDILRVRSGINNKEVQYCFI